ncbi:MAG: hypothetical protein BRD47_04830 [Bacteroidetes bacterium QS_8_68_28]|nr:MAG: hypothetical protein BRD47_04830 [Bacteroidetes bacterium QS_8_68_28]
MSDAADVSASEAGASEAPDRAQSSENAGSSASGNAGGGLRQSCLVRGAVALSLLMLVAAGIAAFWWMQRPSLSEKKVRRDVIATLQREAPSSFLVTGKLKTTVTSTITNDKILLPDVLDLNVGTTETTARVPGTVHYGFDVSTLRPEDIRVGPGDTVTVTLPELSLQSVEPSLRHMEVRTEAGWTRLGDGSGARTREAALDVAEKALRKQGKAHLKDSGQPRRNTARALRTMLTPVLKAAGAQDPVLQFRRPGAGTAPRVQPPTG